MLKHTYTGKENIEFKLIPKGKYVFEVKGYSQGIRDRGDTNGCPCVDLKLVFFDSKGDKVASWTETLIFDYVDKHGERPIDYKIDTFMVCTGMVKKIGDTADFDESTTIGLRGWCDVDQQEGYKDKTKMFNRVSRWLTNEPKLSRNMPAVQPEPDSADDNEAF